MNETNASPADNGNAAINQPQQRDSISAPDDKAPSQSSSASAASSTSTLWPSAPSSPNSQEQEVTNLQDILDRALHDPFSTHPDITAHLKSNIEKYCKGAAQKIYDADVLLVVTGAGFSADSGLATYVDVADIDAYRKKGWRYQDLCKPPTFTDFSKLTGSEREETAGVEEEGEETNAETVELREVEHQQKKSMDTGNKMELDDMESSDGSDSTNSNEIYTENRQNLCPATLPDEDDINHPQYFYGFWNQCCNDYRRVKPHEGYDIIASWGRDKNFVCENDGDCEQRSSGIDENSITAGATTVAQEIRKITHMLEKNEMNDSDSSDGSESFHFKKDDEEEPYYVSPNKRAGAFFVFTSNVDAHSFDVFESHEFRECHGNVEMWQCHNFSCGTNATTGDGGLDGIDCGDEKQQQAQKWQRRLWRLPMDHHFFVDCNTMCAPYSKTLETTRERVSSSPPSPKRRKSSMQDDEENCNTGSIADSGPKADACADNNVTVDASDTATALGGMMDDTMRKHLEMKVKESGNDTRGKIQDNKGNSLQPAHVGDVKGKPRLFPLRYMHPPPSDSTSDEKGDQTQNYFLPMSADENWPRCPRCQEAARPAVLMFNDLDWVFNLKQERRWQRWCQSLLKLCKQQSRAGVGVDLRSDSASTVSDTNMSEKGPSTKQKVDQAEKVPTSTSPPADSNQQDAAASPSFPQSPNPPQSQLKVTILEIGCGYNVPTCRMIAEKLVGALSVRGADATLVRINPSHPEPDDDSVEDFVISIMEKGLVALKMIQMEYDRLKQL